MVTSNPKNQNSFNSLYLFLNNYFNIILALVLILFLGGAYLALGIFISSLTKNQIIAFVLGLVACFGFFVIGADFVLTSAPAFAVPVMSFLGLSTHFYSIARGVIDTKDVIYYISFIFIFLWLNARIIESRGWK